MSQQNSSSEKGKILFIPMSSHGHINFTVPIANRFLELYGDKNEVHYAVNEEYKNKLEKLVPKAKFSVYEEEEQFTGEGLIQMIQQFGDTWSSDKVQYVHSSSLIFNVSFESIVKNIPIFNKIVDEVKPDFIIFDQLFTIPVGMNRGIKWANLFSAALNFVGFEKFPPTQSGLPTQFTPENVKLWNDFIDKAYRVGPFKEVKDKVCRFLKENGVDGLDDKYYMLKFSPYLNIYGYPKELDYQEEKDRQLPGNWLRIETPVTKPYPEPFAVPEKLKNLPGKLIYFSLGSMSQVYKPLMQKMLDVLEQLPHRFIISTGLIGEQYVMKDNMYGEKWLNQFSVLQTVDMIISHGGNNTLTETFNFGKPMIFVPLFGDQSDNAQRMDDVGLGKRCSIFDPVDKLKRDLEDAIEYCSRDSVVLRMKAASERIQKDSGLDRVCEELLKFVKK